MYIVLRTGKAILLLMLAAGPVSAASFDCAKAKRPEEKLICASPEVSRLDSSMASSYRALLQRLSPEAQNDVRRSQREWLAFWPISCREEGEFLNPKSKDAQNCAAARYKDRIALFEGPDSVTGDIRYRRHRSVSGKHIWRPSIQCRSGMDQVRPERHLFPGSRSGAGRT
ncbi:MAG: hypothetical protein RIS14_1159 [Pseudomonadota bacterium]